MLAAIGGGGLLSGICLACSDTVRVVGAEPEGAPTMTDALAAGRPVDAPTGSVAVDSLAPRQVGELTRTVRVVTDLRGENHVESSVNTIPSSQTEARIR